jgi:FdhE protein
MPRTDAGLRTDPTTRLAELQRRHPEWQAWLRLVGEAERAVGDAGWSRPLDFSHSTQDASSGTPLLHGGMLRIEAVPARELLQRLALIASDFPGAASLRRYRPRAGDAARLLVAAVRQDGDDIAEVARASEIDVGALTSMAHFAALPLLRSAGQSLQDRIPEHWPQGYCPVCAAWPIFAERRGLDRSRRLRCGRCAAQWEVQWLYCIYCNEGNHEQLASLEPEERAETLKVETCASCNGYLKSIATLQGFPDFELLLQDLETVELDLVALERGYHRPAQSGFALDMTVADDASR